VRHIGPTADVPHTPAGREKATGDGADDVTSEPVTRPWSPPPMGRPKRAAMPAAATLATAAMSVALPPKQAPSASAGADALPWLQRVHASHELPEPLAPTESAPQ